MITIFDENAQTYYGMGIGVTPDWLEAKVIRERNGSYYFEGEYPLDGLNAETLSVGNVIQTDVGTKTKNQWFDIVRITTKDNKTMVVYAEHVSYRLRKIPLIPYATVNGNGDIALQGWLNSILVQGHGFRTWSDVTKTNQTTWRIDKVPNAYAALGGTEDSILEKWGGEYEFDNFTVKLWKKKGRSQPTVVAFGKNLLKLEDALTSENHYTHILPYVIKDDHAYTLSSTLVSITDGLSSKNIKVLPVNFSEHFKENPNVVNPNDKTISDSDADNTEPETDNSSSSDPHGVEGDSKEAEGGEWVKDSKGWWFKFPDGTWPKDRWMKINGSWFRFKKNGYIYENSWFKDKDGTRYYLKEGGYMADGWTPIKNRWRYFDKDGEYDSTAKKEFVLDEDKLLKLAQDYIEENDLYTYQWQTTVEYVDLAKAGEGLAEQVELMDNLMIIVPDSNMEKTAVKVVATEWNCISEQYNNVKLGTLSSLLDFPKSNLSQQINSAIDSAMATIAGNQAYIAKELKGLVGRTGDGQNDLYWSDVDEEPTPPKGGFKVGDTWWAKNGQYNRLMRWNGESWELLVDTEDPEKMLAKYEEQANQEKEDLKAEIRAELDSVKDESTEKVMEEFKKELNDGTSEFNKKIDERLKNVSGTSIDELKKQLDETSETTKINAELIGGDGTTRYNKNRLAGDTTRDIELGTDYITVGHNGQGFEVGKPYTLSWKAVCVPYGHRDVTVQLNVPWFTTGVIEMVPVDTRFPTITQDAVAKSTVVPMVYYGAYQTTVSGNWIARQTVTADIQENKNIVEVPLVYKSVIDGNLNEADTTVWADKPTIIIDGNGVN